MKKIIGIGLVTAALLAGCGGAAQPNTGGTDGTGASVATTTSGSDISALPTSETGTGGVADTAADATTAVNETAVTSADATTVAPENSTGTDSNSAPAATAVAPEGSTGTDSNSAPAATAVAPEGSTGATGSTTVDSWQPAGIPELGLSFQVPAGWEQVAGENAWSPAGMDTPRVGVGSAEVTADWRPSSFLPEGSTVKSSQQLSVGGAQAMFYTVENTDGTAETHAVMVNGTTAYDFYARAESLQELQNIQPVLNDFVGSVQMGGV